MIEVINVTKTFTDPQRGVINALDTISFTCKNGQIFGLLGPNGAGKTTCLRILATMLKPTSGTAIVDGYDVTKDPETVRQHIGFLTGNTGTYDRMTPWEMVAYFGKLNGMDENKLKERMENIFTLLEMNEFKDTLCAKLSTGMKQKVSIARTIVHDPQVLIFDEPTTGLDILVAKSVRDIIDKLRSEDKTIILSTHIMSEAEKLCDEIGIIHKGKILSTGTLQELEEQTNAQGMEDVFFAMVKGNALETL